MNAPTTLRHLTRETGLAAAVGAIVGVLLLLFARAPEAPGLDDPPTERPERPGPAQPVALSQVAEAVARDEHRRAALEHQLAANMKELAALQTKYDELSHLAALNATLAKGLEAARDGEPVPWSSKVPTQYRPEAFTEMVKQALARPESSVQSAGFDCDEFPCLALLRGKVSSGDDHELPFNLSLAHAPEWRRAFPLEEAVGMSSRTIECEDGTREHVEMLNPLWDFQHDPLREPLDSAFLTTPEGKNLSRRIAFRQQQALARWICASGAPALPAPE